MSCTYTISISMVHSSPVRCYRDCTRVCDIFEHDIEATSKHLRIFLSRVCHVGQSPVYPLLQCVLCMAVASFNLYHCVISRSQKRKRDERDRVHHASKQQRGPGESG